MPTNASLYNVTGASALAAEPEKILILIGILFLIFGATWVIWKLTGG